MDFFSLLQKCPVILAPMSGVTDLPLRTLITSTSNTWVVSEMIACKAIIRQNAKTLKRSELVGENTSVQLIGNDPNDMAEAARLCEDIGAKIIDINFGCPVRKVINGYAGSALMKDEVKAAEILSAVVHAVKLPVTLKMRTGWDSEHRNAAQIAKIAESEGIKMLAVHGRTRAQMYSGKADWKFIRSVKDEVKIPVVVNGDIKCCDSAVEALSESGADAVMIGRGALGRPWILKQISDFLTCGRTTCVDPSPEERYELIMRHYDNIIEYYGKKNGLGLAKKHIQWYAKGIPNAFNMRVEMFNTSNPDAVRDLVDTFFRVSYLNAA